MPVGRTPDRRQIASVPITYHVDRETRLVRGVVRGDFTVDEMLTCVSAAAIDAGEPGYHVVSDHREIGEPATREQVESLVEHIAALHRYYAGARWAVIVSRPASFGMMRMLESMAERVPMEVRVFKDADDAEWWARSGTERSGIRP
jgi:hypothetical protein